MDKPVEMTLSGEGVYVSIDPSQRGESTKLLADPTPSLKFRKFFNPPPVNPDDYKGYKLNEFWRVIGGKPGKIWQKYFNQFFKRHCDRCCSMTGDQRASCGRPDAQDCRSWEKFGHAVFYADGLAGHDLRNALFSQNCINSAMSTMMRGFAEGLAKQWREESFLIRFAAIKERTISWEQTQNELEVSRWEKRNSWLTWRMKLQS